VTKKAYPNLKHKRFVTYVESVEQLNMLRNTHKAVILFVGQEDVPEFKYFGKLSKKNFNKGKSASAVNIHQWILPVN